MKTLPPVKWMLLWYDRDALMSALRLSKRPLLKELGGSEEDVYLISESMEEFYPQELVKRFESTPTLELVQAKGMLYYPPWLPRYIKCICRFLLRLSGIPEEMRADLEDTLSLSDDQLRSAIDMIMYGSGELSLARYLEWAEEQQPGSLQRFKEFVAREKPGLVRQMGDKEFCVAFFGLGRRPHHPYLFVYFPPEAKEVLPTPDGVMIAKVVGLLARDESPPLSGMPNIYLRAICLFGGFLEGVHTATSAERSRRVASEPAP